MDLSALFVECEKLGLSLDEGRRAHFEVFANALVERNKAVNLTRVPAEQFWIRHFLDSLLVQEFVPLNSSVLDIGTGPGFPAWPLACVRLDLSVTAMDSAGKMLDFLSGQTLPNLAIKKARGEEEVDREAFDVVTGRAVAPLTTQLELSAAWAKVGGSVVPFRTKAEQGSLVLNELRRLGLELESVNERVLRAGEGTRLFPIYRKVARTEQLFPRRWAEMKAKPLR